MKTEISVVPDNNRQQLVALEVANAVPAAECQPLVDFIDELLSIRNRDATAIAKLGLIVTEVRKRRVLWPALKMIFRECKRRLWSNRSTGTRLGLTASIVGLVFFGGQSAGIAAMGGAIAIPLWVVFGAGALYANYLRESLLKRITANFAARSD